jgi:hypothetical protein
LGNAYAQAGHDVLYKTHAFGEPTLAERRILDALNGIALSGDLLLEQFYELFTARTSKPFETIHALGNFLDEVDVLQKPVKGGKFATEFNILLGFLKAEKKNTPLELRNAIKDLGFPDDLQLDAIHEDFYPPFEPKVDYLAMLCLIHQTISDISEKPIRSDLMPTEKCKVMVQALYLLQEFSQSEAAATKHLQGMMTLDDNPMTCAEMNSIYFILGDYCENLLDRKSSKPIEQLNPAWEWFNKRALDRNCICGLLFRLADMNVVLRADPLESWQHLNIEARKC